MVSDRSDGVATLETEWMQELGLREGNTPILNHHGLGAPEGDEPGEKGADSPLDDVCRFALRMD